MTDFHAIDRRNIILAVTSFILVLLPNISLFADSTFGGGSGTQQDPYLISNPQHLRQLAADVNDGNRYEDTYFRMTQSFSLWIEPFTPIGGKYYTVGSGKEQQTGIRQFCGTFDGNGNTINDLQIHVNDQFYGIGLFGELGYGAVVMNLTIGTMETRVSSIIMGWGNCGVIAGSVGSNAGIYNCHVKSGITVSVDPNDLAQKVENNRNFGGIAGENYGIISQCTSKATVTNAECNAVNSLGGIVGYNGGRVWSCISLATVLGEKHVGGVAGNSGGNFEFSNNYYHNADIPGAVDGSNVDGATWMGILNYSEWVSGSANSSVVYNDNGIAYYAPGTKMWMNLTLHNNPDGYVVHSTANARFVANENVLTEDMMGGVQYNVFYMPAQDVTISATGMDYQRDIAYTPWVRINIPTQEYTGQPLMPNVTVTDVRDGSAIVLDEGTHYTVIPAVEPMTEVGEYTVTVKGIGEYAGQTAVLFVIDPIGGSSEWYGTGTKEDPYRICSINAMNRVAERIGELNYTDVYFVLGADLDYTGREYKVIGNNSMPFNGHFDGCGHVLSNISLIKEDNYVALFGAVGESGTVRNLILGNDSQVKGRTYVAAIAGLNRGRIEDCTNYAPVTGLSYQEYDFKMGSFTKFPECISGIVGFNLGVVKGCINYGDINGYSTSGGIAAYTFGNIECCVNLGKVTARSMVGGILGYHYSGSVCSCLNLAQVSGTSDVGGIIGYNNGINYTHTNNFYAGNCTTCGIRGTDVEGRATKAYSVAAVPANIGAKNDESAALVSYANGLLYDGKYYVASIGLYDAASNQEIISDVAANYSRKSVSVTLFDRTILRDGNWNTLCLPFAIANIDADNCPLTGATVHELNSASISGTTLNLNFLEATKTIKAGTPYIVRWETEDDDIVSPVFSGVRVSTETHNYDNLASGSNNVCFTGTYRNTAFGNAYGSVLLMDGAKLPYYPQIGATVGACRAYFSIGDENSPSLMLTDINLSFGYDPTGITSISSETDTQAEACYSLSGMKLNKQPSKGIFIQNGRKVVIL
jgi:hypothetical protein